MTTRKIYYLLDNVSETIIGSFLANSDKMAKKILSGFDFKKANLDVSDCSVYVGPDQLFQCETYKEVKDPRSSCVDASDLIVEEVLDFGEPNA